MHGLNGLMDGLDESGLFDMIRTFHIDAAFEGISHGLDWNAHGMENASRLA